MNKLEIIKKGITDLDVDCIVNAANTALQAGGGVCGAIFDAAGLSQLQKACDAVGGCEVGSAVITPGFRLKAKYVIHAVGPRWSGGKSGEAKLLSGCYQNSLQLAVENQCHSIAFPLISAGIFGYPKKEAWEVALQTAQSFLQKHPDASLHVIFSVLDQEMLEMGEKVLQGIGNSSEQAVAFHRPEEENGYLSNWYPAEFTIDGKRYCCSEQYMMEQKAFLFGDTQTAAKIMQTEDPAEMQALGQAVAGFDQTIWNGTRQIIVYQALLAKFRQNPDLCRKLLATEDNLLVECARTDRIWGAGLGLDDPDVGNAASWKGQNLLGLTLQMVRTELKKQPVASSRNRLLWGEKGNRIFWFSETLDGNQKLIRPEGTFTVYTEKNASFQESRQSHAGWQRAMLFMDEYGIWDATAFGCSMDAILRIRADESTAYLFATCQAAEKEIYPQLKPKQRQLCRENVDRFYACPQLQAGWSSLILYPVCFKLDRKKKKIEPIFIGEIGTSEGVLCLDACTPLAVWDENDFF